MSILFVFDDKIDIDQLAKNIHWFRDDICLFPLTSNFVVIEQVQRTLDSFNVRMLQSACLINEEVIKLQKNILQWSSNIANEKVFNKKIKDWFILPDRSGSSWWYGALSEKNAVQETVFFKFAQANAIKHINETSDFELLVFSIADNRLLDTITNNAKNVKLLNQKKVKKTLKSTLLEKIQKGNLISAMMAAGINWLVWAKQYHLARKILGGIKNRIPKNIELLFVSYFPNIDNEAATQNIFKNKYALPLQRKLHDLNVPITWLLMPVYYNGHDFNSALALSKKFMQKEKLFLLQEFITPLILAKSLFWWLRQTLLGLILYRFIDKKTLTNSFSEASSLPIVYYLWLHSFIGASGMRGILFHLTYAQVFKTLKNVKSCLYYCEMQAWEKALVHAKKSWSPTTKTLAFQHTVIGPNYYNYFYDKNDTLQTNNIHDFPAPDVLIANGKQMENYLLQSNYPKVVQAEAIRQLYLRAQIDSPITVHSEKILLVAGSYDAVEMKSVITLLYTAFPRTGNFKIWIKASPINPVEPLFKELGIDYQSCGYIIKHDDVAKLVKVASVAFIANTTVAIEAAANGCPVIVPVLADTLLMNPIVGTNADYVTITSVDELKEAVNKYLENPKKTDPSFIEDFWNIDPSLTQWSKIINNYVVGTK